MSVEWDYTTRYFAQPVCFIRLKSLHIVVEVGRPFIWSISPEYYGETIYAEGRAKTLEDAKRDCIKAARMILEEDLKKLREDE